MDNEMIKVLKVLESNKNKWLSQYGIGKELGVHHFNLTLPLRKLRELFLSKNKPHGLEIRHGFEDPDSKVELHERAEYYYRISE